MGLPLPSISQAVFQLVNLPFLYLINETFSILHALLTLLAFEPKSKADNKPIETAAMNDNQAIYGLTIESGRIEHCTDHKFMGLHTDLRWEGVRNRIRRFCDGR